MGTCVSNIIVIYNIAFSLTVYSLSGNSIAITEVQALAEGLKHCSYMKELT